jgi:MoxR-like ATPase
VLVVLALVLVAVAVASRTGGPDPERERDPLELADEGELRQVVRGVSGIIVANEPDAEALRIRELEQLRPQSPGAADLRDSCVTLYRDTHEAERLLREGRALMPEGDGGVPPELRRRIASIIERSRELITEANESRERCNALYLAAARKLRIEPARRPR